MDFRIEDENGVFTNFEFVAPAKQRPRRYLQHRHNAVSWGKSKAEFHGGVLRMNGAIFPPNDQGGFVPGLIVHGFR